MGTTIPKQLGELLQEKQEPFMLDIYLLEKGCLRNRFNSDPSVRCCSVNSKCPLKRSSNIGVNKKSIFFPNCSKVVKAVFGSLVLPSNRHKVKKDNEQAISNSFPKSDIGNRPNSLQKKEIETNKKLQERYREDIKKLRIKPVSVLDEAPFCDDSSAHRNRKQMSRTRDYVLAVPLFKSTVQLPSNFTHFSYQYPPTKKVLHQSKKLLFDCVRELLESNKWKIKKENNLLQCLGAEEINKLLCEDIKVWSKLSGNARNLNRLINFDFGALVREWSDFEPQKREISAKIGDAILEDISEEIVKEMVALDGKH